MVAKLICIGTNNFISLLTPESEVKVEEPVKFIAVKDEIAPKIKNHEIPTIMLKFDDFSSK